MRAVLSGSRALAAYDVSTQVRPLIACDHPIAVMASSAT